MATPAAFVRSSSQKHDEQQAEQGEGAVADLSVQHAPLRPDDERERGQRQPQKQAAHKIDLRRKQLRERGHARDHPHDPAEAELQKIADGGSARVLVRPEQLMQRVKKPVVKPRINAIVPPDTPGTLSASAIQNP